MLEATTLFSLFLLGTRVAGYGNSNMFYWHDCCKFSDYRDMIMWSDALQSFRYFVLSKQSSYFSLAFAIAAFKLFPVSLYDLKYK